MLNGMSEAERRGLLGQRSTLLGCSSGFMVSSFERLLLCRPRSLESASRPASFCASSTDVLAMRQASAHALSTVDMPLPRSMPTANTLLGASNHFCYPTARSFLPPASSTGAVLLNVA